MMQPTHTHSNELLSRYLDGDLTAEDAARLAAQVAGDAALQKELAALKAVRSAVRKNTAVTQDNAAETTRLRAFARFRATVETDSWQATPKTSHRVSTRGWRPMFVTALGVFVVVGAYLLPSPVSTQQSIDTTVSSRQTAIDLPGDREMSFMFDLHDAHGAPLSTDDAALQRHHTARAQADLLDYADASVAETL